MADSIFKILRCICGKQEYCSAPEKTPPVCPRCASPRSYSDKWYIRVCNSDTTTNRYLAALKTILIRFDLSTRMITMAAESNRIKTYTKQEETDILTYLDNVSYTGARSGWSDTPQK